MATSRTYIAAESATFMRTAEKFGGFSNMAGGYPILAGGRAIRTTEHLYQALRFPHLPDFQKEILDTPNAMFAKKLTYTRIGESRADWHDVNVPLMRFMLQLKLAHNHSRMGALYLESGEMPIVELSYKDQFWGAKPQRNGTLEGVNALGRLHMGMRQDFLAAPSRLLRGVAAPDIPDLTLCGTPITSWTRPERARVLNARQVGRDVPGAVYIGRPSEFGNDFEIGKDGDRDTVIAKFLNDLIGKPQKIDKIRLELSGKDLICWCSPACCHGDVIADIAAGFAVPEPRLVAEPGQGAFTF